MAQGTSTSTGRGGSDAKQTWDINKVREMLGNYLAREAPAENPYTREQFNREGNRANATIAAQGNRQLQDLMAKAGVNGFDPASAAVLMGRQGILQDTGKRQLQTTSQMDDKFRQKFGDFSLQQAGQAIGQRGQDVSQRGLDAQLYGNLLGQQQSFNNQDAVSQNTSNSNQQAQSTNNSQSTNDAWNQGTSSGWNNSFSEWWPIISMM